MEINLKDAQDIETGELNTFGKNEEKSIISLAFDQSEFFSSIISYLKDDYFELFETRFVFSIIKYHYEKNNVIISRSICKDIILDQLTADDPHKDILELVDRESDPREVPIIIDKLTDWAKKKAVLQLYEKSVIEAVERGDFEDVEKIIEDANKITSVGSKCFFFFDEVDKFFIEDDSEKFTTGFETLDMSLNQGGPSRGEVFCWMAPTGKGKCHTLESNIIIEELSNIYELEIEDDKEIKFIKVAGFKTIQTSSGEIKISDLTKGDYITELPIEDKGDVNL